MVTTEPDLINIHRRKREKIHCRFAFRPHVDVIQIEKHLHFPLSARRLRERSS